jgi:hypothetical protein
VFLTAGPGKESRERKPRDRISEGKGENSYVAAAEDGLKEPRAEGGSWYERKPGLWATRVRIREAQIRSRDPWRQEPPLGGR